MHLKQLLSCLGLSILLIYQEIAAGLNETLHTVYETANRTTSSTEQRCPPQPNEIRPSVKEAEKFLPVELIRAVHSGDLTRLKALVTDKNIRLRDGLNNTLAHLAAEVGNVEILRFLVNKEKALIDAKGENDLTPLITATFSAQQRIVQFLLDEKGADPNAQAKSHIENLLEIPPKFDALQLAADNGYLEIVKILLRHEVNVSSRYKDGNTPLHLAAGRGHLEVIKYLLELRYSNDTASPHGIDLVFAKDDVGDMPIHIAAANWRAYVVHYLARVDPRQVSAHGRLNNTVLHIAANISDIETLRVILNCQPDLEALANYEDDPKDEQSSVTALMLAAANGHEEVVRMLLEAGANDTAVDRREISALHLAAENRHYAVIQALLDKNPQSVNQSNNPLLYAVNERNSDVVRLLLKRGADISLTLAVAIMGVAGDNDSLEIFRLLVEYGARLDLPNSDTGEYPIHYAAYAGSIAVVQELLARDPCQLEWRNFDNKTPLHSAIANNRTDMAQYLLRKGANVEAHYRVEAAVGEMSTYTPLITAIGNGNQEVVEALLVRGANPSAADRRGITPLSAALRIGDDGLIPRHTPLKFAVRDTSTPITSRIIELLIRYGAVGGVESIGGQTPAEEAFAIDPYGEAFRLLVANDPEPLHRAVAKDNIELIKNAVRYLPSRLYQKNLQGETAIEMAVRLGKVKITSALVEAGLRVDTVNDKGNTLLHIAVNYPNATIRDQLVEIIVHDAAADALSTLLTRTNKTGVSMLGVALRDPAVPNQLLKVLSEKFS